MAADEGSEPARLVLIDDSRDRDPITNHGLHRSTLRVTARVGKIVELLAEDTATVGRGLFVLDMEGGREDALLHVAIMLVKLPLC